jgi:hypothetical protein
MCASGFSRYAQAIGNGCRRRLIIQDENANTPIERPDSLCEETKSQPNMCALPDDSGYTEPEIIGNPRSGTDSNPLPPKAASRNEATVNKVKKIQSIRYDVSPCS